MLVRYGNTRRIAGCRRLLLGRFALGRHVIASGFVVPHWPLPRFATASVVRVAEAPGGASHDLRRHRSDIEGMRAVAVGLVVAYHAGVPNLAGGYVGVDVFFVISGFLITGLLAAELQARGTLSFAGFYARRARRLLPMATVVLAVTAIAAALVLLPIDRGGIRTDIASATLYFANWHFAAASLTYGTDASVNPVLHYWSLSVEEQFYIVWPLVLFLVTRHGRGRTPATTMLRRIVVALTVIAIASLAASVLLTPQSAPYAYYGLHTRAWELACGGLLALLAPRLRGIVDQVGVPAGWLGLGMVTAAAVWYDAATSFPGTAALLPVGGALLVLAAGQGAPRRGAVGQLLSLRPVTYGGRISYSLYLWHWPSLIIVGTLVGSAAGTTFEVAHGWWAALAVVIAIILSVVSHHLIENPARLAGWMRAVPHSLGVGAAAMAATIGVAAILLPTSTGRIDHPVDAYVAPLPATAQLSNAGPTATGTPAKRLTLAMSPGDARSDAPVGTRDCFSGYVDTDAPNDCVFGDPHGTVNIALIGDSHADALLPAMNRVAQAQHWKLWFFAKPACPIIDLTVRLPQFHSTYPWCTTWQHSVIAKLGSIPDLDTVLVTHFGGVVSFTDRYAVDDGPSLTAQQVPPAWGQAWARTDRALAAIARQVIVIRDVPDPVFDVPDCLDAHPSDELRCSFPQARAYTDANLLYRAERPVSTPSTRFIDIDAALCPGDPCPVVTQGGDIIYRDGQHLTATVSAQLAPALTARLTRIVPVDTRY